MEIMDLTNFLGALIVALGLGLLAVVSNPLIGRTRKSVGGSTFSKWKNLNVLKTKPFPHNPKTNEQSTNRTNFKTVSLTMRRLLAAVDAGYPSQLVKMSGFNASMKGNVGKSFIKNSVSPWYPTVTFANIVFSGGSIDNISTGTVTNTTIAGFQVSWVDNSNGTTAKSTDTAIVIVLDTVATIIGTKRFYDSIAIIQNDIRSGTNVSKSLPALWSGRVVAVYIFMHRDGTISEPENASDTQYIATVTLT